jgi:MFS family permease
VREGREPHHDHNETFRESVAGIVEALRTPSMLQLFLMQLAAYSSFVLIVGLWGGPYLTHIYGYDLPSRGEILFLAAAAQIVGSFVIGPLDRVFGNYKMPVFICAALTALPLGALALFGVMPTGAMIACLVGVGFFSAYTSVLIAHGKSLFPQRVVGRGMTLLNMGTMGGVFFTQTVSGVLIDLFPAAGGAYPLDAYRLVFAAQVGFLLIASLAYLTARDPRRQA